MILYSNKRKLLDGLKSKKLNEYKFLVIRDGLIGDNVFITPVINKLKREYKNSFIDVLVNIQSKDLFENNEGINNLFSFPEKFNIKQHLLLFISLRKYKYDCVFIQEVNTHYTLMARLLGSKLVVGYRNSLQILHDISIDRKGHAVPAEQQLVNYITGCTDVEQTKLCTTVREKEEADIILKENGIINNNFICIQFTCSEKKSVRQLSYETVAKLADEINDRYNYQLVFLGTKNDTDEIEIVRRLMNSSSISLAGKTSLRNLITIIERAFLVIGPDTGTLHIANAVGTPVIMYMGYSDPDDTGPFDKSNRSKVITGDLECIPCKYTDPKPANWNYCMNNRPTLCMKMITLDDIINKLENIIKP